MCLLLKCRSTCGMFWSCSLLFIHWGLNSIRGCPFFPDLVWAITWGFYGDLVTYKSQHPMDYSAITTKIQTAVQFIRSLGALFPSDLVGLEHLSPLLPPPLCRSCVYTGLVCTQVLSMIPREVETLPIHTHLSSMFCGILCLLPVGPTGPWPFSWTIDRRLLLSARRLQISIPTLHRKCCHTLMQFMSTTSDSDASNKYLH